MARSIESFVAGVEVSLQRDGNTQARTKRKLSTVVTQCGWRARSTQRLERLNAALAHAGIYTDHDLLDIYLGLDTTVWFSHKPPETLSRIFYQERAVGYHLGKYKEVLDSALPQYKPFIHRSGGHKKEKKYWIGSKQLIPDLVFTSGRSGPLIVCEIKRGDPSRESVPQLVDYMRAVSGGSRSVVGVLITARPRTRYDREVTREAISTIPRALGPAHWLWYDVSVTLESAV